MAHGARGTRPTRPVSRSTRRPARARPEPVGRPLGEHGDERKRGSAKMPAGPERGLQQLCGIVPSFSLHVGLKRCSLSPCQAQTANPLKMHVVVPLRSRLRWVLRDLPTARCRADLGRCRPLWRSQKLPFQGDFGFAEQPFSKSPGKWQSKVIFAHFRQRFPWIVVIAGNPAEITGFPEVKRIPGNLAHCGESGRFRGIRPT